MNNSCGSSKVLLIEPHVVGHHGPYLQWIIEGLVEYGFKVIVATLKGSTQHPSMLQISTTFSDAVDVVTFERNNFAIFKNFHGLPKLLIDQVAYWWMFRKLYRRQLLKYSLTAVFLPYFDYCLYMTGLLGSPFGQTPWAGIAMRPSFHHPEMGIPSPRQTLRRLKKAIFMHLLKNETLRQVLTIDDSLVQYLSHRNFEKKKLTFLPQPTNSELSSGPICSTPRKQCNSVSKRKMILLYGALSFRKGIRELLQAIVNPAFPKFVDVVLAGKVTEEIRPFLSANSVKALQREKRLSIIDGFICEQDEQFLFENADMVWLGYRGHQTSSGVLVQAARAGRPIIACDEGLIGWQTKHYNLGIVIQPTDVHAVITGIRFLANNSTKCNIYGQNGSIAFRKNTTERAKRLVAHAIETNLPTVVSL